MRFDQRSHPGSITVIRLSPRRILLLASMAVGWFVLTNGGTALAAEVSAPTSLGAAAPSANSLVVVTWNVERPGKRLPLIAREIAKMHRPDVIGLQEITEPDFESLKAMLNEGPVLRRYDGAWTREAHRGGIGFLTVLPFRHVTKWDLPGVADTDRWLQRVVLHVGEERVLFYNTHLTDKVHEEAERDGQVDSLLGHVRIDRLIFGPDHKVVIVGDFNARPWQCAMSRLRQEGYVDAWGAHNPISVPPDHPCGNDHEPDVCGFKTQKATDQLGCGFTHGQRSKGLRIDYVYTGPLASSVEVQVPGTGAAVSDHRPVLAVVILTTADPTLPEIVVDDAVSRCQPTADFVVTLSHAAPNDVEVFYRTEDGTAVAGEDYLAKSGKLTIPSGSTTGVISIELVPSDPGGVVAIRRHLPPRAFTAHRRRAPRWGGDRIRIWHDLPVVGPREALGRTQLFAGRSSDTQALAALHVGASRATTLQAPASGRGTPCSASLVVVDLLRRVNG